MAQMHDTDVDHKVHESPWQHAVRVLGENGATNRYSWLTPAERRDAGCPVVFAGIWDDREPEVEGEDNAPSEGAGCICAAHCSCECACGYRTPSERIASALTSAIHGAPRHELQAIVEHLRAAAMEAERPRGGGASNCGLSAIHGAPVARRLAEALMAAVKGGR